MPELETREVRSRRTGGRQRSGCPVLSLDILTYTEESSPSPVRECHSLYLLLSSAPHLSQLTTLGVFPVRSAGGAVRHSAQAGLRSVASDNSGERRKVLIRRI